MELEDINTVAVLGAGNMGHGIAEVAAMAGYDVNMRDIKDEFVQNGYEQIEWSLSKLAERIGSPRKKPTPPSIELRHSSPWRRPSRTRTSSSRPFPNRWRSKGRLRGTRVGRARPRDLRDEHLESLGFGTRRGHGTPRAVLRDALFNPPVRMQLVEVISGAQTAEETLDLTEALAEEFGKTPVRVHKDSPASSSTASSSRS